MNVCPFCQSTRIKKCGFCFNRQGLRYETKQRMTCRDCEKFWTVKALRFTKSVSTLARIHQAYYEKNIFDIGYVDIETDGQLKGDFANILTIVMIKRNLKTEKTKILKWKVTKNEILTKYNYDRRIVTEFFDELKTVDLVIGHYFNGWKKFDMPTLRVRAEMMKIKIPTYKMLRFGDTWNMAHSVLNLQSFSLGGVARGLGLKDIKTKFNERIWKLARRGNRKCIATVLDHNVKDTILTYRVHKKLEKYVAIPSSFI